MVGNDIVDLHCAKIESNWQRRGFLEKLFTQEEQASVLKSEDSFLQVWHFWSMKEAAYKCYTQQYPTRFFAPKKFDCRLLSKNKGLVVFEDKVFYTSTNYTADYVHSVAKDVEKESTLFSYIGAPNNLDQLIRTKLQKEVAILASEIVQKKSIIGAPLYYHKETLLTSSCTISHHGNYGAFVFSLSNED